MSRGSPVVGFGSTRDVEGTFTSIAGGATPSCPACGVPPLGTQGQLWLVLFSQGWIGTLFFLTFFVLALRRTWRCRTVDQTVTTFVVGIFLLQLSVYDTRDEASPCYACVFPADANFEETRCAVLGVFAPVVGTIGVLQAGEALKLLAGIGQPLAGRLLMFDGRTASFDTLRIARDPACPVCASRHHGG